ncbi:MAG: hypothetical protein V4651_13295 [Bacteroidota bacterium]
MRFSQRQGFTPTEKEIQLDFIDIELKNGLWNIYKIYVLDYLKDEKNYQYNFNPFSRFTKNLWHSFYKLQIDEIPHRQYEVNEYIKYKFFKVEWFELYDFIEYTIVALSPPEFEFNISHFESALNDVLEREFSGFRVIQNTISPITNETEIKEITHSIVLTSNFTALKGCNIHLQAALTKLSDKKHPDYRNSIKESISAIESLAKIISNNAKDSLGASLDKIKGKIKLHSALEKGFKQIYGYTSDDDGIRHALTDESSCDFEDAKFMLVSCSAFINYLIAKTQKAGIKID